MTRGQRFLLRAALLWFFTFLGAMTDSNRVTAILNSIMNFASWPAAITGTRLRLMTAMGSVTSNGTEATSVNCPGYTALGVLMAAWTAITGTTANIVGPSVAVSWTATSNWTPIAGVEIWDVAATPLRWFEGVLSGGSVTVNNGNTLQFAIGSIGLNGTGW